MVYCKDEWLQLQVCMWSLIFFFHSPQNSFCNCQNSAVLFLAIFRQEIHEHGNVKLFVQTYFPKYKEGHIKTMPALSLIMIWPYYYAIFSSFQEVAYGPHTIKSIFSWICFVLFFGFFQGKKDTGMMCFPAVWKSYNALELIEPLSIKHRNE